MKRIVRQAAAQLHADLFASADSGGDRFAQAVVPFLDRLMPRRVTVKSGWILSDWDPRPRPFPGMVIDADEAFLVPLDDAVIVPADLVYGAVEPVAVLDARSLDEAAGRVAELKTTRRRFRGGAPDSRGTYTGAVVAREGLAGAALLQELARVNSNTPFAHQIDLICVCGRGVATYGEVDPEGDVAVGEAEASARDRIVWLELGEAALLAFMLLLVETLEGKRLNTPSLHPMMNLLGGEAMTLADRFGTEHAAGTPPVGASLLHDSGRNSHG